MATDMALELVDDLTWRRAVQSVNFTEVGEVIRSCQVMSSVEFKQIGGNGLPWPAGNRMAHQRLLLMFCGECVANAALGCTSTSVFILGQ